MTKESRLRRILWVEHALWLLGVWALAAVAVGVIAAETQEEADYLGASVRLLQRRIRLGDRSPVASPQPVDRGRCHPLGAGL